MAAPGRSSRASDVSTPLPRRGGERSAHLDVGDCTAAENSSIGGVAATDVEPEWIEIYNVFDATCVCQKPIRREERSRRGGQTSVRTWEFEYHPVSKLVTRRKAPNPQAGSGPFAPTIEWVTTYAQLTGTSSWGAWVPSVEATPFGQHIYSYTGLAYRAIAGHGQTANTTTRSLTNVSLQTTLAGPAVTSGSPVVETIVRNLSSLTGSLPWMGPVQGQPRQMIDGDGVVRTLEYSASGYLTAEILGTDIRTTYTPDAVGNVTSTTAHVTSASPAVTSLTRMPGVGAVITATCNSAGVLRESRAYYDRFGHLAVARQNNLDSIGFKPSRHGVASGSARDWVEEQFHYHHTRLMETYVDRKPLDEAAGGGALFLATAYDYALDGRLVHWSPWRRKRERCCRFSQAASVVTCCRSRPRWRFWQLSGSRAADSGARSNLFWLRIVGMFAT